MTKPVNYAATHLRQRGTYASIAWMRYKVNMLLKKRQLNRRMKILIKIIAGVVFILFFISLLAWIDTQGRGE
jgi:hypothetical protein